MQAVLNYLRRMWQVIKEFWQNIERKDRMRFIAITSVALIGAIVAIVMLTRTTYAVLYSGMDDAELAEVRNILAESNVNFKVAGNSILVPESQLRQWQLSLAEQGYPKSGVSYDWLDKISGFGTSDYEKKMWTNINGRENLRSTILLNPSIKDASVIIAQPDNSNSLFSSEVVPVTASVSLVLLDTLTPEQVTGIITIMATGYPDLKPENVTVTDQYMNILNPRTPTEIDLYAEYEEIRLQMQSSFEREILKLLIPIFGADRVRASVRLSLDFDERESESITFSPVVGNEDGIVVSLQETIEKMVGAADAGQVGTDENGGDVPLYDETNPAGDTWESTIRNVNYDVNQLVERVKEAKGTKITNMTASVTIDSNELMKDLNNQGVIQSIIAGVLGLDRADYNKINVSILPFEGTKAEIEMRKQREEEQKQKENRDFYLRLALYVVLGICLILIIWRVFKLFNKGPSEEELLEMQRAAEMEDLDEYADLVKLASSTVELEEAKTPERMKIEDFIERNPEMVANLLRNWVSEEPVRRR